MGNQSWAQRTLLPHLFDVVITDRNIPIKYLFTSTITGEKQRGYMLRKRKKRGRKKKKRINDSTRGNFRRLRSVLALRLKCAHPI